MTDWPTYETAPSSAGERSPLVSQAPQPPAVAVPAWIGVTLALTVGLLLAMSVVAVSAATSALQLRSELTLVKSELAGVRQELGVATDQLAAASIRISTLEGEVSSLRAAQADVRDRLQQSLDRAQTQMKSDPNDPSRGLGTPPWNLLNWIQFLSELIMLY